MSKPEQRYVLKVEVGGRGDEATELNFIFTKEQLKKWAKLHGFELIWDKNHPADGHEDSAGIASYEFDSGYTLEYPIRLAKKRNVMKIPEEELDALVERTARALEKFHSVIADVIEIYGLKEDSDLPPIDFALFHSEDRDEIRDVILEAIEDIDDGDSNWRYN
jgi:hypothetical protein